MTDQSVKVWTAPLVLQLLEDSDRAVVNAIKGLYARQTEDEQSSSATRVSNGRGFNSNDAPFLSDIAKKLPRYKDHMTDRQLATARRMLRKYSRQLLEIIQEKGGVVEFAKAPSRAKAKSPISETAAGPVLADNDDHLDEAESLYGSF